LRKFLEKNFFIKDTFSDSDSFFDKGIIDSTGIVELISFIENEYEIAVEDEDVTAENLDSINNVVSFVDSKLNNNHK